METHELIAALEANADAGDELTRRLIDDLKERQAAMQDIIHLEERRIEARAAQSAVIVEAAFALDDLKGSLRRQRLLTRMGFGGVH